MSAALVQICTDPRLSHEVIRIQVNERLERRGLRADRVFILNDVGGNVGSNTSSTLDLLQRRDEPLLFAGVLHHDGCLAAEEGLRVSIDRTSRQLASFLADRRISVPVVTGTILTETSAITWLDEPRPTTKRSPFACRACLAER
jgi:hypothetical protein